MADIQPEQAVPTAPPPPSEVKIRTMHSDIAMMAASGGGLPHFESIKVAHLSSGVPVSQEAPAAVARKESKSNLALIVFLIVLLAAMAVVGWFMYVKFR